MDKGPIDGVTDSGKGLAVTSPQTSRRGSFVAPALLFVALLGGALFFGVLAVSGRNETGFATTDNAAVTDPSPSKATPAARTIVTTRPSVTATPPAAGRSGSPAVNRRAEFAAEKTRTSASPLHKPEPSRTSLPAEGDSCAPAGAQARSATGDPLICKATEDAGKNRWDNQD